MIKRVVVCLLLCFGEPQKVCEMCSGLSASKEKGKTGGEQQKHARQRGVQPIMNFGQLYCGSLQRISWGKLRFRGGSSSVRVREFPANGKLDPEQIFVGGT